MEARLSPEWCNSYKVATTRPRRELLVMFQVVDQKEVSATKNHRRRSRHGSCYETGIVLKEELSFIGETERLHEPTAEPTTVDEGSD